MAERQDPHFYLYLAMLSLTRHIMMYESPGLLGVLRDPGSTSAPSPTSSFASFPNFHLSPCPGPSLLLGGWNHLSLWLPLWPLPLNSITLLFILRFILHLTSLFLPLSPSLSSLH